MQKWDLPLSMAVMIMGLLILVVAGIEIRNRWKNKPKGETFWYLCGLVFHWTATVNARVLATMTKYGVIFPETEVNLRAANIALAFIAGVFYFRALTLDKSSSLWKWVTAILVASMMSVYAWEVLV